MPRQNRVTPFGQIVAVPERGTMMGNRGVLHDAGGRIQRPWRLRRWILCVLEFKGQHRTVMSPNRYTELFFLDGATGLAAGHRPCSECRRARFVAFRDAVAAGNTSGTSGVPTTASMIDDRLQAERLGPGRSKRTFTAKLDDLPGLSCSCSQSKLHLTISRVVNSKLLCRTLTKPLLKIQESTNVLALAVTKNARSSGDNISDTLVLRDERITVCERYRDQV